MTDNNFTPARIRSSDPFEVDSGGYSPDRFYTASTNQFDHSVQVRVKMPDSLHKMLSEVVGSDQFPELRTIADAVRDALVHRLHWLRENGADMIDEEWFAIEQASAEMAMLLSRRRAVEETRERAIELLKASQSDPPAARQMAIDSAVASCRALGEHADPIWEQLYRMGVTREVLGIAEVVIEIDQ